MNFDLSINDRPFMAIRAGTKKIEGRAPKNEDDKQYELMSVGDTITFINNSTNEQMMCEITSVSKYFDVRSMLEAEGTKNVLSSGLDIEGGIKSYNSLDGYEDGIKKFGIYAIGIRFIEGAE